MYIYICLDDLLSDAELVLYGRGYQYEPRVEVRLVGPVRSVSGASHSS